MVAPIGLTVSSESLPVTNMIYLLCTDPDESGFVFFLSPSSSFSVWYKFEAHSSTSPDRTTSRTILATRFSCLVFHCSVAWRDAIIFWNVLSSRRWFPSFQEQERCTRSRRDMTRCLFSRISTMMIYWVQDMTTPLIYSTLPSSA